MEKTKRTGDMMRCQHRIGRTGFMPVRLYQAVRPPRASSRRCPKPFPPLPCRSRESGATQREKAGSRTEQSEKDRRGNKQTRKERGEDRDREQGASGVMPVTFSSTCHKIHILISRLNSAFLLCSSNTPISRFIALFSISLALSVCESL